MTNKIIQNHYSAAVLIVPSWHYEDGHDFAAFNL